MAYRGAELKPRTIVVETLGKGGSAISTAPLAQHAIGKEGLQLVGLMTLTCGKDEVDAQGIKTTGMDDIECHAIGHDEALGLAKGKRGGMDGRWRGEHL